MYLYNYPFKTSQPDVLSQHLFQTGITISSSLMSLVDKGQEDVSKMYAFRREILKVKINSETMD